MRTFQQDTVLHVVTERSSSLQVAGGPKAQAVMRTLLSDSQAIYQSTEVEVSDAGDASLMFVRLTLCPVSVDGGSRQCIVGRVIQPGWWHDRC